MWQNLISSYVGSLDFSIRYCSKCRAITRNLKCGQKMQKVESILLSHLWKRNQHMLPFLSFAYIQMLVTSFSWFLHTHRLRPCSSFQTCVSFSLQMFPTGASTTEGVKACPAWPPQRWACPSSCWPPWPAWSSSPAFIPVNHTGAFKDEKTAHRILAQIRRCLEIYMLEVLKVEITYSVLCWMTTNSAKN